MKRVRTMAALAAAGILFCVPGCAKYYQVTDPTTGTVYYTKDIDHKKSGAVVFADGRTGSEITVQSSEVNRINKAKYLEALEAPPPAAPAAPATPPAAPPAAPEQPATPAAQ